MSDELLVSLIRTAIVAAAFVMSVYAFAPILNRYVLKSLALREEEMRMRFRCEPGIGLPGAGRGQERPYRHSA